MIKIMLNNLPIPEQMIYEYQIVSEKLLKKDILIKKFFCDVKILKKYKIEVVHTFFKKVLHEFYIKKYELLKKELENDMEYAKKDYFATEPIDGAKQYIRVFDEYFIKSENKKMEVSLKILNDNLSLLNYLPQYFLQLCNNTSGKYKFDDIFLGSIDSNYYHLLKQFSTIFYRLEDVKDDYENLYYVYKEIDYHTGDDDMIKENFKKDIIYDILKIYQIRYSECKTFIKEIKEELRFTYRERCSLMNYKENLAEKIKNTLPTLTINRS